MEVEHLLNKAPGVHETAVYGVQVAGADGRAGMALVVPVDGSSFDPASFYAHTSSALPSYARPLFVRVAPAVEVTGNFKNRKVRLQDEGFDPTRISDPLWLRDDASRTYVPLDAPLYGEITSGQRKL
jgi:acyl-CoA synthetase (AMP-forming)/AMP-acid ligase II